MRIYATRRQCEQIIIALMATFGSQDEDALKTIANINKILLHQCKRDKSHYEKICRNSSDGKSRLIS